MTVCLLLHLAFATAQSEPDFTPFSGVSRPSYSTTKSNVRNWPSDTVTPDSRRQLGLASPQTVYDHGDPSAAEQLMLELLNRARANPESEAARLNIPLNEGLPPNQISSEAKQPLAFNANLITAARNHSRWMLEHDMFVHVHPDGTTPVDRMRAAGYVFNGSWTAGENLAFSGSTGAPPPEDFAAAGSHDDLFIDEGIEGRGHRITMMNDDFREIGIGAVVGLFTSDGDDYHTVMITQDFGTTDANPGPFVLGVVYRDSDGNGFYSAGEGIPGVTITPSAGRYRAVTSTSGGYAIPLPDGATAVQITATGAGLVAPITRTVTLSRRNVKLDFELNKDAAGDFGFVAGTARYTSAGHFEVDLFGPQNARLNIQTSTDLVHWTKVADVVLASTGGRYSDKGASGASLRFYRAVRQ